MINPLFLVIIGTYLPCEFSLVYALSPNLIPGPVPSHQKPNQDTPSSQLENAFIWCIELRLQFHSPAAVVPGPSRPQKRPPQRVVERARQKLRPCDEDSLVPISPNQRRWPHAHFHLSPTRCSNLDQSHEPPLHPRPLHPPPRTRHIRPPGPRLPHQLIFPDAWNYPSHCRGERGSRADHEPHPCASSAPHARESRGHPFAAVFAALEPASSERCASLRNPKAYPTGPPIQKHHLPLCSRTRSQQGRHPVFRTSPLIPRVLAASSTPARASRSISPMGHRPARSGHPHRASPASASGGSLP